MEVVQQTVQGVHPGKVNALPMGIEGRMCLCVSVCVLLSVCIFVCVLFVCMCSVVCVCMCSFVSWYFQATQIYKSGPFLK